MLKGIDISHHNKNMKDLTDILKYDFVILKASEGMGFKDPFFNEYLKILRDPRFTKQPLLGFYHFARPELNDPEDEAKNFLHVVQDHKGLYALDVEARALTVPFLDSWCLRWLTYVYNATGIKPLIYCSAAETKRFKECVKWGAGLWVAKWGAKPTKADIKPWEFFAIWQYTNSGICSAVRVDENYFNGDKQQFAKYYEVSAHEETADNRTTNTTRD